MGNYRLGSIKRLSKYQGYFDMLAKPSEGKSERTFKTIKDVMIFCAFLGYEAGRRTPLPSDEKKEDIQEHIFTEDEPAMGAVFILGLAETKNWEILRPEKCNELIKIFEEYSNAGIELVKAWLDASPHDLSGVDTIIANLYKQGCLPSPDIGKDKRPAYPRAPVEF